MWRKTEAKPASPVTNTPAPASTPEKPKQTPQAIPQQSSAAPATEKAPAGPEIAAKLAPTSAPPAPAKSAPIVMQAAAPAPAPAVQSKGAEEASTISVGLKIKGEITGTSDLTVDGETQGKIRLTNGRVTIGASGRVAADIDAREIVVHGSVQGNLKASESVRLGPSGQVEGSILTPRIGIDDGARLRGNVEMIRPGEGQEASRRESPEREHQEPAQAARAASATIRQE
jgi:cytoskeletal protein CcmA (bactofilin family)